MDKRLSRIRRTAARAGVTVVLGTFFAVAVGAGASPAKAQGWQGKEETRDGVVHVLNPADPGSAAVVLTPKELWRTGGDSDEEDVLFGVVAQITSDDSGNVYALDAQLNQVVIFSPEGKYLRSIGREGEGPGEFQRPSDLFLSPDGN
ncbi:MAG: 6-bladed beta-propeller, partial [Candidatus Krumholzibacteriota bacterium]|nr:6-bladed beta-propeller [Candidatus Krumholzibacteriota bacterium]